MAVDTIYIVVSDEVAVVLDNTSVPGPPGPGGAGEGTVQSVNGELPDEAGNVTIPVIPGPPGPPGADSVVPGPPGADSVVPGPPGGNGDSAYEIALLNGFVGTEAEWLTSLQGAPGEPGAAVKFKIALSPASAELVGSTDEPTLIGVASATAQQTHWTELRYSDTAASEAAEQEAMWLIGSVITKDYAGGEITVRLRWFATAIAGNVIWRVKLLGRTTGEVMDAALVTTDHSATTAVAGTTLQLVTSEITFTPGAGELTAGDTWTVAIRRSAYSVGDTMAGDAKLVDAGVFEV